MTFELLHTERLILRVMTVEAYRHIFNHCTDIEIKELLNLATDEELTAEKEKTKAGRWTHNKHFLYFQLIDKATGAIIGWCGYHTWYLEHARAEIGYGLTNDSHKKKRLMSEALFPIISYGFEKMKLNRIEAFISPNNTPSLKLVQKAGFQKEGHLREHYYKNNIMEDSLVFSLLKREYDLIKA